MGAFSSRGGGIDSASDIYPTGTFRTHAWAATNTPVEVETKKTYLAVKVEKHTGSSASNPEPITTVLGTVTFTIAKNDTVSTSASYDGTHGEVEEVVGGCIQLTAPTLESPGYVSVSLLPVEIVQPKLDENLEAVKDGSGKDELVDPRQLRFCRWRDAFPTDAWKYGSNQFSQNFIEKDRDRVVIRVPGKAVDDSKQVLKAFVRTEGEDSSIFDPETEVELTRNADQDFEFTLTIMASEFDDQYDPAKFPSLSDENKNDRTHYGKLGGKLVFRIPDLNNAEFMKPLLKPKATVAAKVYLMTNSQGSIANMVRIIRDDFQTAEEIFAQIGISLVLHTEFFGGLRNEENEDLAARLYDGDRVLFDYNGAYHSHSQDLADLLNVTSSPLKATMPTIFYVDAQMRDNTNVVLGKALESDGGRSHGYGAVSAIDSSQVTMAHELAHILGLAIGPETPFISIWDHYPAASKHLLLCVFPEYESIPSKSSLRLTPRDELWLFEFQPDTRRYLETAKTYIDHHEN